MNDNFIREFSAIIEVSPNQVNDDLNLLDATEWDSLAFLSTISLVDRHFKVVLNNDELKSVHYFKDLKLAINNKLGN